MSTESFLNKLLSAAEHPLEYTAGPNIMGELNILDMCLSDTSIGLASPLFAALPVRMDRDVCNLESHLDLLYFVRRTAHVIGLVQWIDYD